VFRNSYHKQKSAHLELLSHHGADLGGNLVVEGTEILLVGSEEVQEVGGSFSGDFGDVHAGFLDKGRGHGLDLVEGASSDGGDLVEHGLHGFPGSASDRADLVPGIRKESTTTEEGRDGGLEQVGQVQLGNQALSVGKEVLDGGLEVEVLDEGHGISDQALSTEESTEETSEQVGQNA